jgi:UDP-N-acetylglucosamine 2-epimerase (non-hydrolysing)
MFILGYGTRPEAIKLFPIAMELEKKNISYKTLFTGQHKDLGRDKSIPMPKPDIVLENVMKHGQSINSLLSKIIKKSDKHLKDVTSKLIVQGDAESGLGLALTAFNNQVDVIHVEAGLRTNNLKSPFPEELNRSVLSKLSEIHFCHSKSSVKNLKKENHTKNVYLVGNTVVDSVDYILKNTKPSKSILKFFHGEPYIVVTLHRREYRDIKFRKIWSEIQNISSKIKVVYITHPSVKNLTLEPNSNLEVIGPLGYSDMIHLLKNSLGVISDSGGIQEEVTSLNKYILICRDTTERQETIDSGLGLLVNDEVENNLEFLFQKPINISESVYGRDVSKEIVKILDTHYSK